MKRIRKGFTLIEMVIVLFIISLLLLIMIPNLTAQRNNANDKSTEALKTTVINQAELFSENHPDKEVTLDILRTENYISKDQKKKLSNFKLVLSKDDKGDQWELVKEASR